MSSDDVPRPPGAPPETPPRSAASESRVGLLSQARTCEASELASDVPGCVGVPRPKGQVSPGMPREHHTAVVEAWAGIGQLSTAMSPVRAPLEFSVSTPLGFHVGCTRDWWRWGIVPKHPVLDGHSGEVARSLAFPDQVRRSRGDAGVLLFYRRCGKRWMCAIVQVADEAPFLLTAYPTDGLKPGEIVWTVFE